MADLFRTAGADRLMSIDLHTAQIQGFFDGPVDHLFALPVLHEYIKTRYAGVDFTVVSPDTGRVRMAETVGRPPRRQPDRVRAQDPRPAGRRTRSSPIASSATSRAARCLLIDDMIATGGTIVKASEVLFDAGASEVVVAATHGELTAPATDRLKNSRISEVIVTNTLPIAPEQQFDKLTVLSIAPLLAMAIREVFEDGSVTSLFDGRS